MGFELYHSLVGHGLDTECSKTKKCAGYLTLETESDRQTQEWNHK
jgi:hypothetical protein